MPRRPAIPTLFPYTTLFRSQALIKSNRGPPDALAGELLLDQCAPGACELAAQRGVARQAINRLGQGGRIVGRSEEHTSELQSHVNLVCRLLLKKTKTSGAQL